MEYILSFTSYLIITVLIGMDVLVIFDRRCAIKGIEFLGLSFLMGMGAVYLELFLMGAVNMQFTRKMVLAPWAVITAVVFIASGKDILKRFSIEKPILGIFEKIISSLIVFQVLFTFFRALIKPAESYDSVAIYALKSKILYFAGTIPEWFYGFTASNFSGAHPDYPLFIPLNEVFVYVLTGAFNDFYSRWIYPLTFLMFGLVFYPMLKKTLSDRCASLILLFFILSAAQFSNYAANGYADMTFGIYFSLSALYLHFWMAEQKNIYLIISFLFLCFMVGVKNEGLLLGAINIVLSLIYVLRAKNTNKGAAKKAAFYAVLACFVIAASVLYKKYSGLANENFDFSMISVSGIIPGMKKIPAILYEYEKQFFGVKKWNIAWILFFALFIWRFKGAFKHNLSYMTSSIILFFAGYTFVYMFSVVEIDFLVRKTASRFLLHIFPVVIFWIALMFRDIKQDEPARSR